MPSELAAYADAGQVLKNFGPVSYQQSDYRRLQSSLFIGRSQSSISVLSPISSHTGDCYLNYPSLQDFLSLLFWSCLLPVVRLQATVVLIIPVYKAFIVFYFGPVSYQQSHERLLSQVSQFIGRSQSSILVLSATSSQTLVDCSFSYPSFIARSQSFSLLFRSCLLSVVGLQASRVSVVPVLQDVFSLIFFYFSWTLFKTTIILRLIDFIAYFRQHQPQQKQ